MTILVSIDPGKSTGVAVGRYTKSEPFKLTHVYQFDGGVEGFLANFLFVRSIQDEPYPLDFLSIGENWGTDTGIQYHVAPDTGPTFVVEKFTARGGANNFAYKTDALEPLRVEGAILAMGIDPIWRSPQHQYIAGGKGSEAKKRQAAWLKEHGFYVTGKTVGCKDADDARSATAHALSYLRSIKHKPTLDKYFRED